MVELLDSHQHFFKEQKNVKVDNMITSQDSRMDFPMFSCLTWCAGPDVVMTQDDIILIGQFSGIERVAVIFCIDDNASTTDTFKSTLTIK